MTEIMTIGYGGLTPREFLAILEREKVRRIIDVRELATSWRPGFAKTALTASLTKAGLAYTIYPSSVAPERFVTNTGKLGIGGSSPMAGTLRNNIVT
jgi:uncharacterized protein (DUF488 family)